MSDPTVQPDALTPGMSLNESLEWRTLVTRFPNADPTNKGQKAVDFTEGTNKTVRRIVDPKTLILTVKEVRSGGTWIQNKLLNPIREKSGAPDTGEVLSRITNNVTTALEKLESQLRMPRAVTRTSSDGSKYYLELRDPERFLIHLEIPGVDKYPGLKASLEAAANELVSRYDSEGLPIRVQVNEPPPAGIFKRPTEPVGDLALSATEIESKYPAAAAEPPVKPALPPTPENIMAEAQRALDDHLAKGTACLGSGTRHERGFAEIGGVLFTIAAVGDAIYVISKADNKLAATGSVLAQLLIGQLVYSGAASALTAAGVEAGTVVNLMGDVGLVVGLGSSLRDDRFISPEERQKEDLENRKREIAKEFIIKRFPQSIKRTKRLWGLVESEEYDATFWEKVQQAYVLLFETQPLELDLQKSAPQPLPTAVSPAPAPGVWRTETRSPPSLPRPPGPHPLGPPIGATTVPSVDSSERIKQNYPLPPPVHGVNGKGAPTSRNNYPLPPPARVGVRRLAAHRSFIPPVPPPFAFVPPPMAAQPPAFPSAPPPPAPFVPPPTFTPAPPPAPLPPSPAQFVPPMFVPPPPLVPAPAVLAPTPAPPPPVQPPPPPVPPPPPPVQPMQPCISYSNGQFQTPMPCN